MATRDDDERFEPVSVSNVECIRATERAILIRVDGKEHWIPQSQIDDDSEVFQKGDEGKLVIPRWLAEQEGLV